MQSKKVIGLSLSDGLLKELDVRRGLVSRSTFVERALREGLRVKNTVILGQIENGDSDHESDRESEG